VVKGKEKIEAKSRPKSRIGEFTKGKKLRSGGGRVAPGRPGYRRGARERGQNTNKFAVRKGESEGTKKKTEKKGGRGEKTTSAWDKTPWPNRKPWNYLPKKKNPTQKKKTNLQKPPNTQQDCFLYSFTEERGRGKVDCRRGQTSALVPAGRNSPIGGTDFFLRKLNGYFNDQERESPGRFRWPTW